MTIVTSTTPTPIEDALKESPRLQQALTAALARVGNDPELLAQHITSSLERAADVLPVATTASSSTTGLGQQHAHEMIASYSHDQATGISTILFPAGYPIIFALHELDGISRQSSKKAGIEESTLKWFREMPQLACEQDISQPRTVTIKAIVDAAEMKPRCDQVSLLAKEDLELPDPRIQALAALLHELRHQTDIFRGLSVRGSVPGMALRNTTRHGVVAESTFDLGGFDGVTASGSPRAGA